MFRTYVVRTFPHVMMMMIARLLPAHKLILVRTQLSTTRQRVNLKQYPSPSVEKRSSHVFSFGQYHSTLDWAVARDIPYSPSHSAISPKHSTGSYDSCD